MKNLRPRKVRKITLIIMLLSIILCFIGYISEKIFFLYICTFVIISTLIFNLLFYRCPICGKFLGRDAVKFCPHCGSEIAD